MITLNTNIDYSGLYVSDIHLKFEELHRPFANTWITSTRGGDTGQGHTWETKVANKKEDNLAEADIYDTEAKTTSSPNGKARVRLFTQNFGSEPMLFERCSHITKGGVRRLCRQIRTTSKPVAWNGHDVDLTLTQDALQLTAGNLVSYIGKSEFDRITEKKINNLILIHTLKRKDPTDPLGKRMQYQYNGFTFFGGLIRERFDDYLANGQIAAEFRLKGASIDKMDKDNGTSFNITKDLIPHMYAFKHEWRA